MCRDLEWSNITAKRCKAGATAYILEESSPKEIVDAVRKVVAGECSLNQETTLQLLRRLLDEDKEEPERFLKEHPRAPLLKELTQREIEVLKLIARGQTNQQVAQNLFISVSTVKKHVHNIISKLGVSDRVQAVVKALELGLLADQGV